MEEELLSNRAMSTTAPRLGHHLPPELHTIIENHPSAPHHHWKSPIITSSSDSAVCHI